MKREGKDGWMKERKLKLRKREEKVAFVTFSRKHNIFHP